MTTNDLIALLPLIVLSTAATLGMLGISFYRQHGQAAICTLVSLALAFLTLPLVTFLDVPHQVTPLFIIDHFALFFMGLIFIAAFAVVAMSYNYMRIQDAEREEYYILILLATLGSAVLVSSNHFATLFLGFEILSVSLYALIGYLREMDRCVEAGIKYLILAAASSAFLLFGMALMYAEYGTMEFSTLSARIGSSPTSLLMLSGLALITTGMGFKLALAPFHMWTPDVYEGAPAPVTAFVATVSKGAMFALVLRFFAMINISDYPPLFLLFSVIAIISMFAGNLLALMQRNVKRILAYSSIAHLGYITVAFLASGPLATIAVTFYLVAYIITSLIAFGIVTLLSGSGREADFLEDYRSLAWRHPWLAVFFTTALMSLAGIPLTAGFIGKFYVLAAGVNSSLWLLAILLVVNSAISIFYYLRIIVAVYSRPIWEEDSEPVAGAQGTSSYVPAPPSLAARSALSWHGSITVALLTGLLIWFGVYPGPLLAVIRQMVAGTF